MYGGSGITYSDRTLVQSYATPFRDAEALPGKAEATPLPESYQVGKFGLMKSDFRDQCVRSYENRQKVGQGYWAKSFDEKQ